MCPDYHLNVTWHESKIQYYRILQGGESLVSPPAVFIQNLPSKWNVWFSHTKKGVISPVSWNRLLSQHYKMFLKQTTKWTTHLQCDITATVVPIAPSLWIYSRSWIDQISHFHVNQSFLCQSAKSILFIDIHSPWHFSFLTEDINHLNTFLNMTNRLFTRTDSK